MKNAANIITLLRIPLSVAMVFLVPFPIAFWIVYALAGSSDALDGFVARKFHSESIFGAKLDSFADLVFGVSIVIVFVVAVSVSWWVWVGIAAVASIRIASLAVSLARFHALGFLHTYANKAAGLAVFLSPALYALFGLTATAIIIFAFTGLSALEELLINISSKKLERNRKSLFVRRP
ncbi:MAG: CDP-alcohol phosphatidyltransferase family protein [Bacilli bacterium]|jgi:CDP-diacylglycerol--glycerol-3-phosphate 3-phosphatidyltransferase|nr:CDP-alcohol phosphatidyltransferase family protein [Bacilli bacterium]